MGKENRDMIMPISIDYMEKVSELIKRRSLTPDEIFGSLIGNVQLDNFRKINIIFEDNKGWDDVTVCCKDGLDSTATSHWRG